MKSRFVLLNLKTSGIKCLEKPVTIQFANKTLDDDFFSKPLIKAIYGTNGEGKTAIAHTLDLYKNTVIDPAYLTAESYIGTFDNIVNHKLNQVDIDLYFAVLFEDGKNIIFHHIIDYVLKDKILSISHEKLCVAKEDDKWGFPKREDTLYETLDGEFVNLHSNVANHVDNIKNSTKNLLTSASALYSTWFDFYNRNQNQSSSDLSKKERSFFNYLLMGIVFAFRLNVYLDEKDKHVNSYDKLVSAMNSVKTNDKGIKEKRFLVDNETDEISVNDIPEYQKNITAITNFLKVFKPDLDKILVNKVINREKVICTKTLVYKNGDKVPLEYESTGVKKLIRLYQSLNKVDASDVSFIDEFDSNIHDVYLCKLIEYFIRYTNGQLIFTTHNLGPMQVLSESGLKHSIDFINNSEITSWKKNGNYSVVKLYRSGLIPNSPFNIDAVSFVKVFGGGKSNE